MHKHNWVHRDVKEANTMMRIRDDPCSTILIDYGLAKFHKDGIFQGHVGTDGYTACEVRQDEKYSTSVDQFSAGNSIIHTIKRF